MRVRRALAGIVAVAAATAATPSLDVPSDGRQTSEQTREQGSGAQQAEYGDVHVLEAYFPLDETTTLHADVFRSADVPWDVAQPVVLTVSPFMGHEGPFLEYGGQGPSLYWSELWEATDLLREGWTHAFVDLPGFGGSNGCNDWGGEVDQAAVAAAVDWVREQPWSTGSMGMLGGGWDGWMALIGAAQQPEGLEAAVAFGPVFSGYHYAYTNGLRVDHVVPAPAIIAAYDVKPGPYQEPEYTARAMVPGGYCHAENLTMQQQDDLEAPYWVERNTILQLDGTQVPVLVNQGFLETSTSVHGAIDALAGLASPDSRAWLGWYDTSRPWEQAGGEAAIGRDDLTGQVLEFLERHVKGVADLPVRDRIEVSDNLGRWRGEDAWPPVDALGFTTDLRPGAYEDDGENVAWGSGAGAGAWSVSPPLPHDVWLAGEVDVAATLQTLAPRTNLVANVYDIAADGTATFVSRGGTLVRESGSVDASFAMYAADWVFDEGHRIGVLLSGSNADWWRHVPTGTSVEVVAATATFPMLTSARTSFRPDAFEPTDLVTHLQQATIHLDEATTTGTEVPFTLPPDLGDLTAY